MNCDRALFPSELNERVAFRASEVLASLTCSVDRDRKAAIRSASPSAEDDRKLIGAQALAKSLRDAGKIGVPHSLGHYQDCKAHPHQKCVRRGIAGMRTIEAASCFAQTPLTSLDIQKDFWAEDA